MITDLSGPGVMQPTLGCISSGDGTFARAGYSNICTLPGSANIAAPGHGFIYRPKERARNEKLEVRKEILEAFV